VKQYETGFILSPGLAEEETEKIISQMSEIVSERHGKMIKQDRWGKKRLAYPIKRFQEGFYVFFLYEGGPEIPLELERRFKQMDSVIRFLTIKKDPRTLLRRRKKREQETARLDSVAQEMMAKGRGGSEPETRKEER
jgi:small subunit ribosomal protein S6